METVSIIVPCYNEQSTIRLLLEAIHAQTYPLDAMTVIIADGMSTDDTRIVIEQFEREFPELKITVIDNPQRTIPAGLNRAIDTSQGDIIIRLDAHSIPQSDYVERCVKRIQANSGENIGGVWDIRPRSSHWIARGIAAAAGHPFGVGDAKYRYASTPGEVDTVPFGAYRRSLISRIGKFDENLLTNEDYEFNVRVRESGGRVFLDPEIRSIYFSRATLGELARQYWRYGYWKVRMLRRYPNSIRWRQIIPPIFVLSIIVLGLLAIWMPLFRWMFSAEILFYAIFLGIVGLQLMIEHKDVSMLLSAPLAISTMHISWGSAFLISALESLLGQPDRDKVE